MVCPFLVRCLAHPLNREVAHEVAAAVRLGVPLSVARGARLPGDAWSPRDWALAQAVEMLDRSRCPGCGQPTWLSHDKATRKQWKGVTRRCFACDASLARRDELKDAHRPESIHTYAEWVG